MRSSLVRMRSSLLRMRSSLLRMRSSLVRMRSSLVRMRSSLLRMRSSLVRMRSSLVVRASDCQCTSCNGPEFDPSIRRHSGIWGAADEAVLNIVRKKKKKNTYNIFAHTILNLCWVCKKNWVCWVCAKHFLVHDGCVLKYLSRSHAEGAPKNLCAYSHALTACACQFYSSLCYSWTLL